ncbi:MAG: DUF4129 domain-containing protein [Rhizobacter sp.]|nr:DUF4129 domain-containing protein [Rhizobacter sp.]
MLSLALLVGSAHAAEPASAPTRQQVNAELDKLRADPDLAGTQKQKTLRFKENKTTEKKKAPNEPSTALLWLREFSRWMTDAGRLVVWVLAALAVALFIVGLRHWVRVRAGGVKGASAKLPSHVRDLDIRPESLPDQVGAAAAALWQRGEHRAALSLLYRGALSQLVHQHAVPIRAASTEGECVALAATRLPPEPSALFSRLVQAWQLAVYGARLPESSSVLALCADFDRQFSAGRPA